MDDNSDYQVDLECDISLGTIPDDIRVPDVKPESNNTSIYRKKHLHSQTNFGTLGQDSSSKSSAERESISYVVYAKWCILEESIHKQMIPWIHQNEKQENEEGNKLNRNANKTLSWRKYHDGLSALPNNDSIHQKI
ncbi:hypothetical protein ACJMK2_024486 [Sinanodonta woodiana]|uniref:Uncharacterized protein n=1 Tax=Sinanodonta woodiana TaxID=1069815 RepID=A0ABD3XDJ7_SINWO